MSRDPASSRTKQSEIVGGIERRTLTVWSTSATIINARGALPRARFAPSKTPTATAARSSLRPPYGSNFHFLSVGLAIGAAVLVTSILDTDLVWLLASFASTACYLLALGVEFTVADGRD